MPFLSPAKVLVILVVALVVLGPDKLPKVAKQIGALWGDFRKFRERLESEVRGTFPDLPSSETISQAVRSPLTFLDTLADNHSAENGAASVTANGSEVTDVHGDAVQPSAGSNRPAGTVHASEDPPGIPGVLIADPGGIVHQVRSSGGSVPDDPGMN
ncbi:MAG: twin-arginine translocase TatA/TatE family subunit [Acidimicrobiales bacterium]